MKIIFINESSLDSLGDEQMILRCNVTHFYAYVVSINATFIESNRKINK